MCADVGQRNAGGKKYGSGDASGTAEKVGRASCAKYATCRATAERCAHVCTFAMLQKHQHQNSSCCDDVNCEKNKFHSQPLYILHCGRVALHDRSNQTTVHCRLRAEKVIKVPPRSPESRLPPVRHHRSGRHQCRPGRTTRERCLP